MDADEAATLAYFGRQETLAERSGRLMVAAWDKLGSYNETDVARLEQSAGPVMAAIQTQSIALTAGYLSAIGKPVPLIDKSGYVVPWRDPFIALWRQYKIGADYRTARRMGRSRAYTTGFDVVKQTADDYLFTVYR